MRILAVLYCYPPLLVPASLCYLKLMAGLVENGVEVEVLTISPDTFYSPGPIPLDTALERVAPPSIKVHAVRSPETTRLVRTIKFLDPKRLLTWRWLEPRKREWVGPALKKLRALDLGRYDLLLTCSQPHANHLLGLEWRRLTDAPWVAYFSDPWTENPYDNFASGSIRAYHARLEDEVLRSADLVLFTCQEMLDLVADNHGALDLGRAGILPHAFVPEWYVADPPTRAPGEPWRLLHTGSFYGPRTPMPLLDSLSRVAEKIPLEGALRVDSYGGMDDRYRRMIAERDLGEVVGIHGFVPYLDSLVLMANADALLLVDAALTTTGQSVFLPSKLIDYLGAGIPVIAVTPSRGATARVVREIGGTVVPIEEPAELDRLLLGILEDGVHPSAPRPEAVRTYEYREVGLALVSRLRALLDATSGGSSQRSTV